MSKVPLHKKTRKETEKQNLYMTVTRAKEYFCLTDSMIREIGEPDLIRPNPYYPRAASPMRLYLIERLEDWVAQNLERVEKARQRRAKLSVIQKELHAKKRKEMEQLALSWTPQFTQKLPKDIIYLAIIFYSQNYDDFNGLLTKKGLIAYIRHEYTDYEDYLWEIEDHKGKTGNHLLYLILREKVDEMITSHCKELLEKLS